MNPQDAVGWVCAHQDIVLSILAVIPIASAMTWWTGLYDKLPPWAQALLHILAANFLHAVADPPPPKP